MIKRVSNEGQKIVRRRRNESGQALVFVTIGLATFIAAAGLAIDMGYLRYEKRLIQAAADAAALAAATDVNLGNAAQASADAQADATSNGFQNGVNNTTVTVNIAPTTLPVADPNYGNPDAVQVEVQKILPMLLAKIIGINTTTIGASAVSTVSTSSGCMYALQAAGLTLNAGVSAPNCGIVDNGALTGAGDITAASVAVSGSFAGYTGVSTPAPEAILQPAADPLAYVTPPPVPGVCTQTNFVWTTGAITLTEGVYCGGITISGGTVTFNPGLYILTGATGLQITGTGGAAGANVAFYNTGTGPITFSSTGIIGFSAPTPADAAGDATFGSMPGGLVFYQDPTNTAAADLSEAGSGNVVLSGAVYFPTATVTVAGSLDPHSNTLVVASGITVAAGSLLDSDSTGTTVPLPSGSPLKSVSLVE